MLGALAFCSSLLAGYAMGAGKARSPFHRLRLRARVAATVYVIVDLEYPRLGLHPDGLGGRCRGHLRENDAVRPAGKPA